MKSSKDEMATDMYDCYQLKEIVFVPSYYNRHQFVQPGHTRDTPKRTFTQVELVKLGAKKVSQALWLRP